MPEPHDREDPATNRGDADTLSTTPETISMTWSGAGRKDVVVPPFIGNVKIGEEIGRGGMGIVHEGWDTVLRRTVAVKFLLAISAEKDNPQFDRFFGGARAEAAVKHPNIVGVYDAGQVNGLPYLVLEYIDGPSLREVTKPHALFPLSAAVAVMWDVAEAVQVLHGRDIVHCDLKPGNVLFERDGHLLVTDFGLASLRKRSDSSPSAVGTPAYMAPEMFNGNVSPQSDVYAMGVMLFELLAGRLPFTGDLKTIRDAHCESPLPIECLPDDIPVSVIELIERATHKKEVFRYKRGELFQRALQDAVPADELRRDGAGKLKELILEARKTSSQEVTYDTAEQSSTTTYFNRISELAAEKRAPEAEGPQETGQRSDEEEGIERPVVVTDDSHCIGCGYSLRGLFESGQCPECGTPVQRSRQGDLLAVSDHAWVARITKGEKRIYTAFQTALLNVALLFAGTTITMFVGSMAPGQLSRYVFLFGVAIQGIQILAALLLMWGIFGVTALDPRLALTEQPRVLRRFVRGAAVACVVAIVASWLVIPLFRILGMGSSLPNTELGFLFRDLPRDAHLLVRLTRPLLVWSFVCGFMCALIGSFFYLSRLAVRIPNPALAARTKSRAKGFAVLVGLLVLTRLTSGLYQTVPAVPAVITGVLVLLMIGYITALLRALGAYRMEFTRCLQQTGDEALERKPGATEEDRACTPGEEGNSIATANHQSGSSNPRDILKLRQCPQCEYDLAGLPRRHRCPECGFDYDESMFVLYGWLQADELPTAVPLISGTSILTRVYMVACCALMAFMLYKSIESGDWQLGIYMGFVVMFTAAGWMWRRRILRQRGGAYQLAFSSAGAGTRRGPGRPDFIPWTKFRTFSFRRAGRDRWRLRLSSGIWHLRLRRGSARSLFGGAVVAGVVACSRREAALIRNEIRRRFVAAQRGAAPATDGDR